MTDISIVLVKNYLWKLWTPFIHFNKLKRGIAMFGKDFNKGIMDYINMGKRIKDIRNKKGITQEKLGELTELSPAHISNIETAHTKVSLTALVAIANALKVSLDEIVCDSLEGRAGELSGGIVENLNECDLNEIRIINDTLDALKKSLLKNRKL